MLILHSILIKEYVISANKKKSPKAQSFAFWNRFFTDLLALWKLSIIAFLVSGIAMANAVAGIITWIIQSLISLDASICFLVIINPPLNMFHNSIRLIREQKRKSPKAQSLWLSKKFFTVFPILDISLSMSPLIVRTTPIIKPIKISTIILLSQS